MGFYGGGGGGGDGGAAEARRQEELRQARIREGMQNIESAFSPFNDQYYAGKAKAYSDYYLPQLKQQFDDLGYNCFKPATFVAHNYLFHAPEAKEAIRAVL